ncbi:MAG: GntR family transcriptional regulator [Oscillospiraceae bacterium]
MSWNIDSDKPIFKQLMDIITNKIISGEYPSGEKLLSVRELAALAKVNPNTMQKALSELEQTGLIITQRTNGRFVTADTELIDNYKKMLLNKIILEFLNEAKTLGISYNDIIKAITQSVKELEK